MKLKSLALKKDVMKGSFVKDNSLISKGILSVSQLHSNPIVKEKSGGETGYPSSMGHEAENRIALVSFGISNLKRES